MQYKRKLMAAAIMVQCAAYAMEQKPERKQLFAWGMSERSGPAEVLWDTHNVCTDVIQPGDVLCILASGYDGVDVARYAVDNLPACLQDAYKQGNALSQSFERAFLNLDNQILARLPTTDANIIKSYPSSKLSYIAQAVASGSNRETLKQSSDGECGKATAGACIAVAYVSARNATIAWAGNVHALLVHSNGTIQQTKDHTVLLSSGDSSIVSYYNKEEAQRLKNARVPIDHDGLLCGTRTVTRALGDRLHKDCFPEGLIPDCEVVEWNITDADMLVMYTQNSYQSIDVPAVVRLANAWGTLKERPHPYSQGQSFFRGRLEKDGKKEAEIRHLRQQALNAIFAQSGDTGLCEELCQEDGNNTHMRHLARYLCDIPYDSAEVYDGATTFMVLRMATQ